MPVATLVRAVSCRSTSTRSVTTRTEGQFRLGGSVGTVRSLGQGRERPVQAGDAHRAKHVVLQREPSRDHREREPHPVGLASGQRDRQLIRAGPSWAGCALDAPVSVSMTVAMRARRAARRCGPRRSICALSSRGWVGTRERPVMTATRFARVRPGNPTTRRCSRSRYGRRCLGSRLAIGRAARRRSAVRASRR